MKKLKPVERFNCFSRIVWCLALLLMLSMPATGFSAHEWLDIPVSVTFRNQPLSEVLETIGSRTGITIVYDQALANERVLGTYDKVAASEAILRLFKGRNKIIQISDEEKIIVVKTFGAKSFIWAGPGQHEKSITLAELDEMHARQYREYRDSITDENMLVDEGITLGELNALHEEQYAAYKAGIRDDQVLDGGITRGELNAIHEQQYQDYQAAVTSGDDAFGGSVKREELDSHHEQQYLEYRNGSLDKTAILPGSSVSRSELDAMHEQQYNEMKNGALDGSGLIAN